MDNSLCETLLQGIMVIVLIKTNTGIHSKMMNTSNKIPYRYASYMELAIK